MTVSSQKVIHSILSKYNSKQPTSNGKQPANDSKQIKSKINQPKPR